MGCNRKFYSLWGNGVSNVKTPPGGYEKKTCDLCGAKSLYYAGKEAFCGDHKTEAIVATSKRLRNYPSYVMKGTKDPAQPFYSVENI